MKYAIGVLLIFCVIWQIGCTTKEIENYNIDSFIKSKIQLATKLKKPIALELCNETKFEWNSLIFIPPYSRSNVLNQQNLNNSSAIKRTLSKFKFNEGICIILFVNKNSIVKYSLTKRTVLDFNELVGPNRNILRISQGTACNKLYIKNYKDKLTISF